MPNRCLNEGKKLRQFIASLPPLQNFDNSFEVRWSLSDLENIVYDFINTNNLPSEFKQPYWDVDEEDLMKVHRFDKNNAS